MRISASLTRRWRLGTGTSAEPCVKEGSNALNGPILIALLMVGCSHLPEPDPIYSAVPARQPEIVDTEQVVNLQFRFRQEHEPIVTDTVSNGWHVVTGLPELDNYEAVSNYWFGQGMESRYESNVVYYRKK